MPQQPDAPETIKQPGAHAVSQRAATSSALVPRRVGASLVTPLSIDVIETAIVQGQQTQRYIGAPLTLGALGFLLLNYAGRNGWVNLPEAAIFVSYLVYTAILMASVWRDSRSLKNELRALGVSAADAQRVHAIRRIPNRDARKLKTPQERAEFMWRRLNEENGEDDA